MQVEASMPLATVMPIERLALAPAPVANTKGRTPRMNANEVIRIGRKRIRAASTAAFRIALLPEAQIARELHDQDGVLAGERDQQHEADLHVETVGDAKRGERGDGPRSAIGTASSTAAGALQLSYCAASARQTSSRASANT